MECSILIELRTTLPSVRHRFEPIGVSVLLAPPISMVGNEEIETAAPYLLESTFENYAVRLKRRFRKNPM